MHFLWPVNREILRTKFKESISCEKKLSLLPSTQRYASSKFRTSKHPPDVKYTLSEAIPNG